MGPTIKLIHFKCLRCNHVWLPRTLKPIQCPRCRNRNWTTHAPAKEEAAK